MDKSSKKLLFDDYADFPRKPRPPRIHRQFLLLFPFFFSFTIILLDLL